MQAADLIRNKLSTGVPPQCFERTYGFPILDYSIEEGAPSALISSAAAYTRTLDLIRLWGPAALGFIRSQHDRRWPAMSGQN